MEYGICTEDICPDSSRCTGTVYDDCRGSSGFIRQDLTDGRPLIIMCERTVSKVGDCENSSLKFTGRAEELLTEWLGEDAFMFQSPSAWKEIIGHSERIESVETWEMACFDMARQEWLATGNPYAMGDKRFFDTVIRPYTCFVGISVRIK